MILQRLKHGMEVLVRKDTNEVWAINWFDKIGEKGFHTAERKSTPLRYITDAVFAYMGTKEDIACLDFNKIKKPDK